MRETITLPFLREKATKIVYPNGYTLVFVPKRGNVFNVSTWVRTGSIHEDNTTTGISHFLEHLMFKGTERFKPGEFDRAMESMGAIINAATWKDFTFYYVTGPKDASGENFRTALDMHADMMLFSTLPHEEIGPAYDPDDANYKGEKRERAVVIEEMGMRDDQPWTKVYNAVNRLMYPEGHPYRRDVIGTKPIIAQVPRDTIVDYYRRWYAPATMTTIVAGDLDLPEVEKLVEQAFDFTRMPGAKATEPVDYDAWTVSGHQGERYAEVKGQTETSFFIQGFHGPTPGHLRDTIALDVFSYVLGEGRSSRLVQELVEKPDTPLFNALSTGQSTFKLGNVFFIQGNFNSEEPKEPLAQVCAELERLLDREPVTEDEFRSAVKKLKVNFAETSETASGIAETIGESLTVMGDLSHYTEYLGVLETLDRETVQSVARQYLSPDKAFTSVLVPAS